LFRPILLLDGKLAAVHSKRRNHILIHDLDTNGTLLKTVVARSSNVTGLVALPDGGFGIISRRRRPVHLEISLIFYGL
jgi:hypothetical protein